MASSGTVYTSYQRDSRYYLNWQVASTDIANNRTKINWQAGIDNGNWWYLNAMKIYTIYINGSAVSSGGTFSNNTTSGKTQYLSGSTWINHNSDGTKTFSISFSGWFYDQGNVSGSNSFTLPSIPRQANLTSAPNFNDEENPTISYSNPAGTAVSALEACISWTGGADIAYRAVSKTGTSYTFSFTNAERDKLRAATTTSNSKTVTFYLRTTIGGKYYYSTIQKTLSIVNANPTFPSDEYGNIDAISYADTNEKVTNITKPDLMIVQNKSNLVVTYKEATAKKSATISKYTFTLNGVTKTSTSAGGTVNFGKVNSDKDLTLSVTVTDSRGNKASTTKTIKCCKYYSPSFVNFKAYRVSKNKETGEFNIDANGTWIKCEYTTNIADVEGKNARTISIHGVGTDPIPASGNSHMIDLKGDKDSTYKIYATVQDLFSGSDDSEVYTVYGGARIINVHPSGEAVAFGKKVDYNPKNNPNGLLECKWDAQFLGDISIKGKSILDLTYPVGSIYMSANSTNPATLFGGTWKAIEGQFLIGRNSTYTTAGGSSTVKLTVDNMPSHTHKFTGSQVKTNQTGSHQHEIPDTRGVGESSSTTVRLESWEAEGNTDRKPMTTYAGDHLHTVTAAGTNANAGGGKAFSIMPPYLPVYMWQRTA